MQKGRLVGTKRFTIIMALRRCVNRNRDNTREFSIILAFSRSFCAVRSFFHKREAFLFNVEDLFEFPGRQKA